MLNGTYNITLHSPLGPRHGTLTLEETNFTLRGSLNVLDSQNGFQNGSTHDNHFSFSTEMHTLLGNKPITVTGFCEGDGLVGFLTVAFKKIPFTAVRSGLD